MDKQHQTDKDKKELEQPSTGNTVDANQEEGVVYVVNDDGTPFDTSDRTYVSVDLPDEETNTAKPSTDGDTAS